MDKSKNPGIALQNIQLIECCVGEIKPKAELRYSVSINEFQRAELMPPNQLTVKVGFDLMAGIADPPCKFTCKFMATYQREGEENMKWSELPDHVVIAHIVPFFREFVSNMTHRMPIAVLNMVPPVNTSVLLSEYRQKSQLVTPVAAQGN